MKVFFFFFMVGRKHVMIFISSDHTIRNFRQDGKFSVESGGRPRARRPGHCGEDMELTLGVAPAADSLPSDSEDSGPDLRLVWQCRCGFRLDNTGPGGGTS
jgi:hypothetical protein